MQHAQFSQLEMAKYAVVHDYCGGAVALAARLGVNPGTLSNKVNPTVETHHLSVDEAVAVQNLAGDHRILHAEAQAQDHVCIPIGEWRGVSDTDLVEALSRYMEEVGETAGTLRRALEDGVVTPGEMLELEAEAYEDVAVLMELLARVRGLVRDE